MGLQGFAAKVQKRQPRRIDLDKAQGMNGVDKNLKGVLPMQSFTECPCSDRDVWLCAVDTLGWTPLLMPRMAMIATLMLPSAWHVVGLSIV